MNHVYLVLAHKNPGQLYRLVERLSSADTQFVIHVDAIADINCFTDLFGNRPDITFLEERYRTQWGSFAIVEATLQGLKCIKDHLPQTNRVTLLSGLDYPIKPVKHINAYLQANPDAIFLEYFPVPARIWINGGIHRFPKYAWISNIMKLYGGSQWWSFPMFVIDLIFSILNDYPLFIDYFKLTRIPDESFFQTLLLNSDEDIVLNNLVNTNLKSICWDLPYSPPRTYLSKDLPLLSRSKNLFARKFDEQVDTEILNQIDFHLLDEKRRRSYKKNLKKEAPNTNYAVVMLTNTSAALPGYNKLKSALPDGYSPWLLFHKNESNAEEALPVQNIFTFDDSILHTLGFTPIESNLLPGSNHFPLLSFYRKFPHFDYYWLVEDDVYFNGPWSAFFKAFNDENLRADFISSNLKTKLTAPNWYWWHAIKNHLQNEGSNYLKIASFNPIYRISNRALSYLNEQLLSGWCGHHEVLIPTLLHHAGYTILDFGGGEFGFPENKNRFYTTDMHDRSEMQRCGSMRYRPVIEPEEIKNTLLYHPVKPGKTFDNSRK